MSAPLSNELFFEAHRGIHGPLDKSRGLGMHFTAKRNVAHILANKAQTSDEYYYKPGHTTLIHADIPVSSIETDTKKLEDKHVWLSPTSPEEEIPVKSGAPVKVKSVTTIKSTPRFDEKTGVRQKVKERSRTRRYNPPRNMTA